MISDHHVTIFKIQMKVISQSVHSIEQSVLVNVELPAYLLFIALIFEICPERFLVICAVVSVIINDRPYFGRQKIG